MEITIFGLGYVGSVVAACMARDGHNVIGIDLDINKVSTINNSLSPIVEPQLGEAIAEAVREGRLRAQTCAEELGDVSFVSVGTPSNENGSFGLGQLLRVAERIGVLLARTEHFHVVNIRSTVLPGTVEGKIIPVLESSSGKKVGEGFGVCVNPEFMRETTAVYDYYHPPVTVIGSTDERSGAIVADLYKRIEAPLERCTIRTAEMMKYACNAFHAVKITFANEIGNFCKALGIDSHEVMEIFCKDTKLNLSPYYLKPGFAFGGSCLPKDVRALNYRAKELDLELPLFQSIMPSNHEHLERAVDMVLATGKKKIALLGLSFKAATDDLRESPQVQLAKRLLGEGRELKIWDDNVSLGHLIGSNRQYIDEVIPHVGSLLCPDLETALADAEVVVIGTRGIDRGVLSKQIRPGQRVIDLVNLEKSRRIESNGSYDGICW